MDNRRIAQPGLTEVIVVWAAVAVALLAGFVTAARLPVERFYHVSEGGVAGAAGRMLVVLNYPMALVAVSVILVATARLLPVAGPDHRPLVLGVAATGVGLCFVTNFAVSQDDLDARPINAIPAIGVAIAVGVTLLALRAGGVGESLPWRRIDTAGAIVAVALLLLGIPWILAKVGIYVDDIPGMDPIFISKELGIEDSTPIVTIASPGGPLVTIGDDGTSIVGVHVGEHHGFHGMFLALSALALARVVGSLRPRWFDRTLSWWLALTLAYGLANMFQDWWGEQVVKRGWSDAHVPNMTRPELRPAWAVVAVAVVVAWLVLFYRRPAVSSAAPAPRRPAASPA